MKNKIINLLVILGISMFTLTIGVKAVATLLSSEITYNDTNVQAELDKINKIINKCPVDALCSKVKIGDYVSMTPTQTTYTIPAAATGYTDNQTINPSELNLWRVIDIRNDGTIEMISEYVSSNNVYFQGQQGYLNLVGTLNTIANQYGNSKYTIGARHIGYHGQTSTITNTSKFTNPAPWESATSDNSNEKVGGGDMLYQYDADTTTGVVKRVLGTLSANKVGTATETSYWLASRYYDYIGPNVYRWFGRRISEGGGYVNVNNLYNYNSGFFDGSGAYAIRPIVTLRPDITLFTGSGTSDLPWVLS